MCRMQIAVEGRVQILPSFVLEEVAMKRPKNKVKARTKIDLMYLYADTYNAARRALYIQKDFDKAERLFNRLYRVCREMSKMNNSQFNPDGVFSELGNVYFAKGRYGRALWFLTTADKLMGPADPHWCAKEINWTDQAKVHIARGNLERANDLYVQAIESIIIKATDANNQSILSGVMKEFAAFLSKQGRFSEAETYCILSDQLRRQAHAAGMG